MWESYTLGTGDIDVYPVYTAVIYEVTFKAPGQADQTFTYSADDLSLFANLPAVPDRIGYKDGAWYVVSVDGVSLATPVKLSEYTVTTGDLVIEAKYTIIIYTATFYDQNGNVLAELPFTVEDDALTGIPAVPQKEHYTSAWEDYTLGAENLHIRPVFTPVEYTATFTVVGETHYVLTYTVENTLLDLSQIPPVAGLLNVTWYVISVNGEAITPVKLSEYTVTHGHIVLEARGTLIEYNVSFVVNGTEIGSDTYTIEDKNFIIPTIPASFPDRLGYTKDWYVISVDGVALATPVKLSEYTVTAGDLVIEARYTPITYTATFYDKDGNVVATRPFTVEDLLIADIPAVPERLGYTGEWGSYIIGAGDLDIYPVYTAILYEVIFKVPGQADQIFTYTVEDLSLFANLPTAPDRLGYTKDWYVISVDGVALATPVKLSEYTVTAGDLVIEVQYTAIEYTATFKDAAGSIVGTAKFTVEGFLEALPTVPDRIGYKDGFWVLPTTLPAGDMVILPEYTAIVYTITFQGKDGSTVTTMTYTLETLPDFATLTLPAIPDLSALGYANNGVWYVGSVDLRTYVIDSTNPCDFTVQVKYTAIEYTATFYDKEGNELEKVKFTVEGFVGAIPAVPTIAGYENGMWIYTTPLQPGDMEVHPSYTLIQYTASYWVDGVLFDTKTFTVEDLAIAGELTVPGKLGYTAAWSTYVIGAGNLEIEAIYTAITYTVTIKVPGQPVRFDTYTVEEPFVAPAVPDRIGYQDGAWYVVTADGYVLLDNYTETTGSFTIEAKYVAIEYTATFKDALGTVVGTAKFTVEGFLEALPAVPDRVGYENGSWMIPSTLPTEDITVAAEYTVIRYTAIFQVPTQENQILTYTVEDALVAPAVPSAPVGYVGVGEWYIIQIDGVALSTPVKLSEYTGLGDLVIQAVYEFVEYTATFRDENGGVVAEIPFTLAGFGASVPAVPTKHAYVGEWYVVKVGGVDCTPVLLSRYTFETKDIEVAARYFPIVYNVTFVQQDGSLIHKSYTVADYSALLTPPTLNAPLAGYMNDGAWYVTWVNGSKIEAIKLDEFKMETGNLVIEAVYTPIEYTANLYDYKGDLLKTVIFTVEELYERIPAVPERFGYDGAWYVISVGGVALSEPVLWTEETLPAGDMEIRAIYTLITYTVNFYKEDGTLLATKTYTVEAKEFDIPAVPAKLGFVGEWYVVTSNGMVRLSEYEITDEGLADLTIRAIYELKQYVAYFRVDGVVVGSLTFTVETKELTGLPELPAKRGYAAKWADFELGFEDLYIDAIYTVIQYTATFQGSDGKTVATVNFTINDTAVKAPEIPQNDGRAGAWYVVAVNGVKIDPVLLETFALTDADLTIQAIYEEAEVVETRGFAWYWWLIMILILIIIILIILLILQKKNLPPFKRVQTPPAIIAAAVPEEEEEEEEETPVVPIVTVDSVDVETADELMSDATAIAMVETLEAPISSAGMKVILNLHVINDHFAAGDTVDLDALKKKRLISAKACRVKILADGMLDKPLTVIADGFSVQAIKMITLTGGHAVQKKAKR